MEPVNPALYPEARQAELRGIARLTRRLRQTCQVLLSPAWTDPATVARAVRARYEEQAEISFYTTIARAGWYVDEVKAFDLALTELPPAPRVLVVGCGAGRECFALEKRGVGAVLGIDISEQMVAAARKLAHLHASRVEFVRAEVHELKLDPFDLLVVTPALDSHIPGRDRRVAFLRELRTRARADSRLVIVPHIRPLRPRDPVWAMSLLLRARWGIRGEWEPGDSARSYLGNHTESERLVFFHYYPSAEAFQDELRAGGFIGSPVADSSFGSWLARPV